MGTEKRCLYYRKLENPAIGCGIGYCDLGVVWAICEGDIKFCEEPEGFVKNFYETWKRNRMRELKGGSCSERPF